MEPTREEVRTWLRTILKEKNLTPTALSREAGLSSTTLTRFLNDEATKTVLSFRTIAKIAAWAGVNPVGIAPVPPLQPPIVEVEARQITDLDEVKLTPRLKKSLMCALGEAQFEAWEMQCGALEDVGIRAGDIIILNRDLLPERGDIVCAHVFVWSKGQSDLVFRVYEPPFLVSASRSFEIRKPYVVDGDTVRLHGVVTDVMRSLRQSRS
jgi:transcriptional regulator with XRE-family HTH domain